MTTDRTSSSVSSTVPRGLQRRKPAPLVLEARIMFDGAAVATAAEAVKPVAAEAPVAHVAELGSVVAASQADSRSTAPAETAKAADTSKNAPETAKPVAAERATDGLASSTTKVLFVDSRVPDYQAIVAAAAADVKVVILDADHDGVQQIADALEGMHNVASISIVSHGDSGLLLLGNTALHAGDMAQYQAELGKIGSAMQAGGEILLYGCDVGAGSAGESFIHSLADATGAVVAASTDSTGDVAHGGNWDLEIATGALTSAPVLDVAKLANYDYSLYTTSVSTLAQLKAALATAATDNLDDIITLTANITFVSASDTITYAATDAHKTTIMGVGNTISGANLTQVLHINSGSGSVELNNLTITNGVASGKGGDSYDQTIATTADKVGGSGLGGGIFNAGTLTITNSTISNNKATGGGGGGGHINQVFGGAGGGGSGAQGVGGASGGTATGTYYGDTLLTTPGAAGSSGSGGRGGSALATVQATQGGIGGSSAGGGAGGSTGASARTYLAGGGSGGTAGAIGGGGGGAGFNGPGGRGGDAAGGIYNTGTLVITGSTVIGNLAAAGGGGGSGTAREPTSKNVGPGGNGGNAYGGIWNNGGTVTSTGTTYTSNVAGAGKGGLGSGTGNSNGADGAVFTDGNITSGPAVPPAITGTTAGQAINDNVTSTLHPFQGVTITGSSSTVTITLDSPAKGSFTAASLTAAGFTTSNGGLTYTHASDTAANLQTALQALVYQPVANRATVTATETTTFTVVINDGSQSVTDSTTTVVSTSINDAPTGLGNTSVPAILEDAASPAGVAISALTGLNFADVDVSSSLGGIAVSGNTANSATQGVWQYSADAGAHWYVVGSVSTGSALMLSASSMLRFIPVADYNGTLSGLTVRAVDNTYTGGYTTSAASETRSTASVTTNGGSTAFAASTNTVSTSVTAVNDVPVFTKGGNQTVLEDAGAQTVSGWATGISAGAANESGQTLNFIVTNNNNALFSTQPSIDASGNLTFTGAANANGTATVTVAIHDNGGTANGGVDTSTTQTFTITITPVNDAPTGVGNLTLPTILEDVTAPAGTAISALSGLAFADVDSGDTLGGLAIVGNTANATTQGAWQYSTNGTNWYAIGTVSDGASLMVSASTQIRFVPVADYNGTPPSLTVRALDSSYAGSYSIAAATQTRLTTDTSSHGGSTAISDNTNTIGITVTAVNDAPTFTKGADQTVLEDAGAQTVSNWATNLVKGPADESSQTLSFTVTNSNNALFSAQPSIDASGNLTFTGAANANGTATVTVVLHDSGGTANGGVDTSTQTFTITITPVNDAPTGLPAVSGSSTEGQVLTASTSGIADVDGLVGVPFNHQWQVSADGTTGWVDISGATASTYTLDSAQVGKYVRDKVSFTDNGGTLETLFSAASSSIAGVVPQVDSISRAGSAAVSGSATSVVYNVTFNVAVTGVGADDFMLTTTTGNAAGVISSISGSGTSYQVTVNMLTGDGDLRLDLKSSGTGIASGSAMTIAGGFTAGQAYTLDHTPPSLTAVSMPNSPLRGGDVQTVTFTVANDGGSPLTLVSGTVGGYSLSGLTRINSTTYSAQFTVTSGGTDVAAGNDVPVSIVLADAAGNQNTAFTTPISQANDSINGNAPTLLNLSNASVQTSSGANALVGALSTTDASAGDTFTYALVSGAGDTNNTAFTLVNGNNLTVNDPATLGNGTYSVRIRTTDSGGNQLEQTFTITLVNDAPTGVGNLTLPTILEDVTAPAGAAINALSGLAFADVDSGDTLSGLAIVGNSADSATQGTWQYSTNGSNWYAIGTVSDGASLMVSASTRIRFVPVADYNGTPPSLTVRALDSSYAGSYSIAAATQTRLTTDTSSHGGSTAISDNTNTIGITVTAVNDAPTGLPAVSGSSTEGQVLTASTSGIADVDGLVGVPFNHQWQVSADGTTGWVDISGATASTYTLDSAQVGKYVRDKVSFTDNGGTLETLFSAASSSIAGVVPQVDSISRAGSAAVSGSATSVVYNVTFNVAVTGVGADDFMLTTTTGNAAGVISSISGSGTSYQVTVNMLTGDGDLRLDLKSSGTGIASGSAMTIAGGFTAGQAYTLDHTPPSLTAVSMPNSPLRGGDVQTVTFTVANDGGSPLTLVSGTVGGYSLSGLTRINSTTYSAQFTVTSSGTDVAAGNDVPVSIVLADAAGNQNTAFTTPISQANDSINGNAPTLLNLSNASVQTSSGANALVGALSTTDASAGDTFTYALVSGAGDTNNTAFTLVNGNNLTVNDPATLGNGTYSVRIRTTDSGGNQLEQTFTITVSSYSAPVAVADTASATEAGGIANATAGVNPIGNVLANDQSSNTRTVTAIAGGAVGAARVGTYGSLTLNADGTYTYTVNNSNAAVQALRTNADTLTDTFTYTMADNTAATSTSTLTITIQGGNDVPRDATALTTQQVTVSTPLLYVVPVGTFADVDAGDTLTYTATLNGGAPLPAWLTFNAATRTFSGTPTAVENLSIVVTATDLSATSVSNTFTLQVAAAAPSGGGGTPTTPTTPTDPQVPNNPQPVQPITAVEQTPLQIISETVVDTVTTPDWSANQMISETLIIRTTNTPILPTTFGNTAFVGTGTSFVSSSGSFSPANERYSPLSPTPFNDFQRTQTDGGWGLFSVVISPAGQSGLTILRGIDDQSFTPGDRLSFTVPADAFGHSDPQPGIVLKATLADARSLPTWLTFNSTTGLFEGTPPPGFKGELAIKVTAKDSSGHQAEVTFRVKAQSGRTSAEVPHGRSGLSEQLRSAAVRTALWASGRT